MRTTPEKIVSLKKNEIFVFGSNEAGIHGAGAAKLAWEEFGAELRVGFGETGRTFAIPTKDRRIETLPLPKIEAYVNKFIEHADQNPDKIYLVTEIGCGLAGYKPINIAPMFLPALKLDNVILPQSFLNILNDL